MTARDILNRAVLRAVNVDIRLWSSTGDSFRVAIEGKEPELVYWINQYAPEEKDSDLYEVKVKPPAITERQLLECRSIEGVCAIIGRTL